MRARTPLPPGPRRVALALALAAAPFPGTAQMPGLPPAGTPGEALFEQGCAECHTPAGTERAPGVMLLNTLSPRSIVAALEDGVMRDEGAELTARQRVDIAEYLTGRAYVESALPEAAFCETRGLDGLDLGTVAWMGYGGDLAGTGFQPAERAGLDASSVPGLRLSWAFAFPDASQVRTKPTVV